MDVDELRDDIKLLLGGKVVNIEIDDHDIGQLINMAYRKIKPYISDRKLITVPAARVIDLSQEKVLEVLRVFPANQIYADGNEIMFDFQAYRVDNGNVKEAIVGSYGTQDMSIRFQFEDGKLYLSPGSVINSVTAECIVDVSVEDLKDERAISWIQDYSMALCKESLGRIRGKFRSSNLPVELDGETLLSEAQSMKDSLESQLLDRDFGPSFVLR